MCSVCESSLDYRKDSILKVCSWWPLSEVCGIVFLGGYYKDCTTGSGFLQNKASGRREKYIKKEVGTSEKDGENGELGRSAQ